ncbi:hypothetical protein SAMN05444278_102265 [Psychroflexus salarius]|uniref:DUF1735 domain-containing protein n=1 Tax=Psychroflexus salarius TaxID=1155689 RepID=A0A1M4UAQ5_9FLAO|nr:DUF1735 domain-containing protein [Psychroflexus salarius]SHE53728.1 hypothetical protein SAMN05444278_102265 [Psychroflexus salarius]
MKNIFKIFTIAILFATFTSCEEDVVVFDAINGQEAYSFSAERKTITNCDPNTTITVESTIKTNSDRTINLSVDETSNASPSHYELQSSVTIPAGEYIGSADLSLNFDEVAPGSSNELIINLENPSGTIISARGKQTIAYEGVCTLNSVRLDIAFDDYPEETAWFLIDGSGQVVADSGGSFGTYADQTSYSESFCLPSGSYTFEIYDQFGDGICCAYGNGSYNLTLVTCEGESNILSGGEFGQLESTPFDL